MELLDLALNHPLAKHFQKPLRCLKRQRHKPGAKPGGGNDGAIHFKLFQILKPLFGQQIFPRIHIRHEKCLLQAVPKQFIHSPQGKIQNRSKLPLGYIRILIETPADQSHSDHNTLSHTTGELMWILLHTFLHVVDAYHFHHLHGAFLRVLLGNALIVGS